MGAVLDFIRPREAQQRAIADALREDRAAIAKDLRALAKEFMKQGRLEWSEALEAAADRVAQARHRRKELGGANGTQR